MVIEAHRALEEGTELPREYKETLREPSSAKDRCAGEIRSDPGRRDGRPAGSLSRRPDASGAGPTPVLDRLCGGGETGLVRTVPEGMAPGSDTANLSILGYEGKRYYRGRASLEALALGICLGVHDLAFRCDLTGLSGAGPAFEELQMGAPWALAGKRRGLHVREGGHGKETLACLWSREETGSASFCGRTGS